MNWDKLIFSHSKYTRTQTRPKITYRKQTRNVTFPARTQQIFKLQGLTQLMYSECEFGKQKLQYNTESLIYNMTGQIIVLSWRIFQPTVNYRLGHSSTQGENNYSHLYYILISLLQFCSTSTVSSGVGFCFSNHSSNIRHLFLRNSFKKRMNYGKASGSN